MYQVIAALQHMWHLLHNNNVSAPSDIIQRSLVIVEQLTHQSTHKQITDSLVLLQQQLGQAYLQQYLAPLNIQPNPQITPWFQMRPNSALPTALESMGAEWRDAIKQSKDNPYERLKLALQMLPYTTAFNEAAIALRAILREKTTNTDAALQLLYLLAAIHSFIALEPETPSGDKVAAAISGTAVLALGYNYASLGSEALPLLNLTDKTHMEEVWGPAQQHLRLSDLHPVAWQHYQSQNELL